jgi:hypothetical protein
MEGKLAPLEWRNGLEGRVKVVEYCMDDVKKTRDIFIYGVQNGFVYYNDKNGIKQKNKVSWKVKLKEEPKLNLPVCYGNRKSKKVWQCKKCVFDVDCRWLEKDEDKLSEGRTADTGVPITDSIEPLQPDHI